MTDQQLPELEEQTSNHYVNKEELHAELVAHIEKVKAAKANGMPLPIPNDKIGRAIIEMAKGISYKYNFRQYSWLDEMIDDGILAATNAINKYDPERSSNPFGFFSQCIYWAFQGRIKIEKKNIEKRQLLMTNVLEDFYDDGPDGVHHDIDKSAIISLLGD